jgi:hypothetical protein
MFLFYPSEVSLFSSKEIQFITTQIQEYLISIKDNIQVYGNFSSSLSLSPEEVLETKFGYFLLRS